MSLVRSLAIARANLVRLLRDRLGLFFILVLPLIIILVTGLQFGGGFEPRVGLLASDGGELADELVATLERDWQVERYADASALARDVEDGRIAFGVALPDRYSDRLLAGETLDVEYRSAPNEVAIGRRSVVTAAIAEQASVARAARFAVAETGAPMDEAFATAEAVQGALPEIEVDVRTLGESLFPPQLAGFALGAQSQLVLFIFLTSLTGSAQLILSRTLGVSRRMLSTSTPMPAILLGEALGRFGVALFQGLFIVAATALAFGVDWGDPLGAGGDRRRLLARQRRRRDAHRRDQHERGAGELDRGLRRPRDRRPRRVDDPAGDLPADHGHDQPIHPPPLGTRRVPRAHRRRDSIATILPQLGILLGGGGRAARPGDVAPTGGAHAVRP